MNNDSFNKNLSPEIGLKIESGELLYSELISTGLIDENFRVINKITDEIFYENFFNNTDLNNRVILLKELTSKYINEENLNFIINKSRDSKNINNIVYLPDFIKRIIYALYKILSFNNGEENKELSLIVENLKKIYVDVIKNEKIKKDITKKNIGEKQEDFFFNKIKFELEKRFGNNFYILRASEFDDYRGVDFVIYHKNEELKKDTPIACVDLGNISSKHFDGKDNRVIDMYDYIYHDYESNSFRKFFRKNLPIFNVDTENKEGYFFGFIKSVYTQFKFVRRNDFIKQDYKARLQDVLRNVLVPSLSKDLRAKLLEYDF